MLRIGDGSRQRDRPQPPCSLSQSSEAAFELARRFGALGHQITERPAMLSPRPRLTRHMPATSPHYSDRLLAHEAAEQMTHQKCQDCRGTSNEESLQPSTVPPLVNKEALDGADGKEGRRSQH